MGGGPGRAAVVILLKCSHPPPPLVATATSTKIVIAGGGQENAPQAISFATEKENQAAAANRGIGWGRIDGMNPWVVAQRMNGCWAGVNGVSQSVAFER